MITVNAKTMVCLTHDVEGCRVCVLNDFFSVMKRIFEARRRARTGAKTPIDERFDVGGES